MPREWIRLSNAQGQDDIRIQLAVKQPDSSWIVCPESDEEPFALLERVGRVPLPPYIRKGEMVEADRRQYQTVYARWPARWPRRRPGCTSASRCSAAWKKTESRSAR